MGERTAFKSHWVLYVCRDGIFVSMTHKKGLIYPVYVFSNEIVGGIDGVHFGLERELVFVLTANVFPVKKKNRPQDIFPVDKRLPSTLPLLCP